MMSKFLFFNYLINPISLYSFLFNEVDNIINPKIQFYQNFVWLIK